MKKFWKEDLTLPELKSELKRTIKKLNRSRTNKTILLLSFAVILLLIGILVFVLIKNRQDKLEIEFDDGYDDDIDSSEEIDENGCRYTDDDDFEEVK